MTDECPIQQAALLQVEDQLSDRPVDFRLEPLGRRVAAFVRVPMDKGDVLGRYFDEPGSGLGEPPGQQAAQSKTSRIIFVEAFLRFQLQVERACAPAN